MKRPVKQAEPLKLLVFLGNPGSRYERTRHNTGRYILETIVRAPATDPTPGPWKEKFHGTFARSGQTILLAPDTYMNESGRSVQAAIAFFGIARYEILVVHDDLETAFGTVQLAFDGGHRGNNGVRSIGRTCGGTDFWRLRVGIGRPPAQRNPGDWVLERFSPEEEARLPDVGRLAGTLIRNNVRAPAEATQSIW